MQDSNIDFSQLPIPFMGGGKDNSGCIGSIFILAVIVIAIILMVLSCEGSGSKSGVSDTTPTEAPATSSAYEQPLYYPPATPLEQQTTEQPQNPQREEPPAVTSAPIQPTVTISKYYEEGYDAGYDDGEDDAVSGNGWGGQFDDSCRYKGKARKDYQLGYEEGYEAGYYDNKDGDE